MVRWLKCWLSDRHFQVRLNDSMSSSWPIGSGVPQGSPLSPLLFIIYTSDMCSKAVKNTDCNFSMATASYADDTAIWASRRSLLSTRNALQRRLSSIELWCNKWRLILNPDKCEVIIFGYNGGRPPSILISLNNTTIKQVTSLKYLGVTFSSRLGWKQHIDNVSKKCKPRIGQLRGMAKQKKFKTKFLIDLVTIFITSVITYAIPAWFNSLSPSNINRISTLHINALRAAQDLTWDVHEADILASAIVSNNILPINDIFHRLHSNWQLNSFYLKNYFKNAHCSLNSVMLKTTCQKSLDTLRTSPFYSTIPMDNILFNSPLHTQSLNPLTIN